MHNPQKVVDLYSAFIKDRTDRLNTSYYGFALLSLGEAYFNAGANKEAKDYYVRSLNSFKSRCGTKFGRAYDCSEIIGVYASQIEVYAKEGNFDQTNIIYQLAQKEIEKGLVDSKDYVLSSLHLQAAIASSLAHSPEQAENRFTLSLGFLTDEAIPQGPARLPTIRNSRLPEKLRLREWLLAKFKHYARQADPETKDLAFLVHQKLDSLLYYASEQATMTAPQFTNNLEIRKHYEAVLELADELHHQGDGSPRYHELAFRTIAATKGNALRRRLDGERIAEAAGLPSAKLRVRDKLQVNVAILRSRLATVTKPEQKNLRDSLIQLTYQLTALDEQLKNDYPLFKQALERPAIPHSDDFRRDLPSDQAVVDYFVGFSHIHATVTSRNHPLRYYSFVRSPEMEEWIASMLTSSAAAGRLHDALLMPILNDLSAEIDRLQFIPDDILWQIPFAALMDGEQFLIEDYAVSTAYSIQSLHRSLKQEALDGVKPYVGFAANYSGFGLPASPVAKRGMNFSALPLAPREVNAGAKLMNGEAFTNERATKEAFLKHYRQRTIIHCALHGVLDEADPFLSSLVFQREEKGETVADYLPLSEILGLPDLAGSQLVILSACHSDGGGLQAGEGINSMARGFRLAGVKAVLASRWEITDETGFQLMKLYQERLRQGMTLDHALRSATLTYLKTAPPQYATPHYWAGLTSLGGQQILVEFTDQYGAQWSPWLIVAAPVAIAGLFFLLLYKKSDPSQKA